MFRLIKWLFISSIITLGIFYFSDSRFLGKTAKEHVQPFIKSHLFQEGVKDIRAIASEGLKAAGDLLAEEITDEEKKQLTKLLNKELTSHQQPTPSK